jgi:type IV secretory pathway VirB10-like protein
MGGWNPWKLTAIGMALVMATALITGLVVANWTGSERDARVTPSQAPPGATAAAPGLSLAQQPQPAPATTMTVPPPPPPPPPAVTAQRSPAPARHPGIPGRSTVSECNRYAAAQASHHDKTAEVVKDGAIGAVLGAAVGAASGAIAGGGKTAGKGAAIGGLVGAGGGALYGVNENRKQDERYRIAYSSCLRSHGYGA